ncbi:DUF2513 domain-containing protein [Yersinia pseudotuberculosis]|uniref:DUF2513 domain-containing protein n=1 Tax=Yersinia pseudotuberculosis TaxID=633 RepID=UPI000BF01F11|nr:DUF2513 domain-containing protein [Yersinia pseudotuberculosis]AXY32644.1 DUF2513 domain-containing protein [Yersinia pseudotuberculosis]PEI12218.1 hypothetical protein CRM78_02465 [Yersinia pseudotuberculosis]
MKINHEYLKNLLIAFENTTGPDTILSELEEAGFSKDDSDFIFHMRLLHDNGLIIRVDGNLGFGQEIISGLQGYDYYWVETPLRLTARGHDFIADLRQKEVWQTIKTEFKDEGLSTLMSVARSLAEGFAKKKIKEITGIDVS